MTDISFCQNESDSIKNQLPRFSIRIGASPGFVNSNYDSKNLGIGFCSEINYLCGKHFAFGTGLYFYDFYGDYPHIESNYQQINIATTGYNSYPNTSDYYTTTFNKQIVSIPFTITYHLTNQKKGIYLGVGLNFDYEFRYHDKIDGYLNNIGLNYEEIGTNYYSLKDNSYFSATIKAGYNFHLSKNIYGFLEAGIYATNSFTFCNAGASYF